MFQLFKFIPFLIDINSKTLLISDHLTNLQFVSQFINVTSNLNALSFEPLIGIALELIPSLLDELWEKIQDGLTLNDIENVLFCILFLRFIILSIRYNLKTSFYITCIGLFAGYLWYRHFIDIISMYRSVLFKLPFLHKLGMDAVQLRSLNQEMLVTDLKIQENVHWYNPGQMLYYALKNGIINIEPETGLRHYIDPISMFVSNLKEPIRSNVVSLYYKIYNNLIPKLFYSCSKFWTQLSGVAVYAIITRIGKRYCPYLIRWHWTFLLIMGMVEQIPVYFIYRAYYFQTFILIPQAQGYENNMNSNLTLLNGIIAGVVLTHISFVVLGLFHAIWGQYFYVPFFVENTELHIGKRPKNSIYSGGQTAWQEPTEKNVHSLIPKIWYGWFGHGTKKNIQNLNGFKKFLQKIFRKLKKQFRG